MAHFHCFGPWTGTVEQYRDENRRTPDSAFFSGETLPPVLTGHALLRPKLVAATAATPVEAVKWLEDIYAGRPPSHSTTYLPLEDRVKWTTKELEGGSDASWVYYLPSTYLISYQAICCPNRQHPDIPCPQPSS